MRVFTHQKLLFGQSEPAVDRRQQSDKRHQTTQNDHLAQWRKDAFARSCFARIRMREWV
jgi:hypothetical protein